MTIHVGSRLTGPSQTTSLSPNETVRDRNLPSPLSRLLLQIILITVVARVCGSLVSKIGQPRVIGEMIAGILLGPSFLGFFSPATAFPVLARIVQERNMTLLPW